MYWWDYYFSLIDPKRCLITIKHSLLVQDEHLFPSSTIDVSLHGRQMLLAWWTEKDKIVQDSASSSFTTSISGSCIHIPSFTVSILERDIVLGNLNLGSLDFWRPEVDSPTRNSKPLDMDKVLWVFLGKGSIASSKGSVIHQRLAIITVEETSTTDAYVLPKHRGSTEV